MLPNTMQTVAANLLRQVSTSGPGRRQLLANRCIASRALSNIKLRQSTTLTTNLQLQSIYNPTKQFTTTTTRHFSKKPIPRKAALHLTPLARETFQKLIAATDAKGIMLRYEISSQHALRMAFKFDLIRDLKEIGVDDEGVSLELLADGTPKPPSESWNDNLPKLYIHHGAFMKVLGGTLDVELNADTGDLKPKLFDREGYEMDPNA